MHQLWRSLSIGIVVILIGGGSWWWYTQRHVSMIDSYQTCADAGYPILTTYPPQCRTADGRTFVGTLEPTAIQNPLIQVKEPEPHQTVGHTITITGSARGSWYFEATFSVKAVDAQGQVIATGNAHAQGEWTTEEFVPFKATLTLPSSVSGPVTLILERANPSGLPERNDSVHVGVTVK